MTAKWKQIESYKENFQTKREGKFVMTPVNLILQKSKYLSRYQFKMILDLKKKIELDLEKKSKISSGPLLDISKMKLNN